MGHHNSILWADKKFFFPDGQDYPPIWALRVDYLIKRINYFNSYHNTQNCKYNFKLNNYNMYAKIVLHTINSFQIYTIY